MDGVADGGVGVGVVGVGGGVTVGGVASIVKLWVTEVAARKLFVPSWVAVTVQVPTSCKVTVSSEIEQTFLSVDSRAMFPPDVAETNWRRLTVGVDRYCVPREERSKVTVWLARATSTRIGGDDLGK